MLAEWLARETHDRQLTVKHHRGHLGSHPTLELVKEVPDQLGEERLRVEQERDRTREIDPGREREAIDLAGH